MASILKPPATLPTTFVTPTLFLAGSTEMGRSSLWRHVVETSLQHTELTILNPRRDDWDATWVQAITNVEFRAQVEWELEAQERADLILMYFSPETQAPITLLELGLFAHTGKLIVCCPSAYLRKGNVDIVCARYGIAQVPSLSDLCNYAATWLQERRTSQPR